MTDHLTAISIIPESARHHAAIRVVNERAFGRREEADLVDALRAANRMLISLVALSGESVVGHILFSPVTIESAVAVHDAVGLAPMAVLPEFQRRSIGSMLVRHGMSECARLNHVRVVVLGHPRYYPRFGFVPANRFGLTCEYAVPNDVFMAAALRADAFDGHTGRVRFAPEFLSI
jgi:putative acetyltransferase